MLTLSECEDSLPSTWDKVDKVKSLGNINSNNQVDGGYKTTNSEVHWLCDVEVCIFLFLFFWQEEYFKRKCASIS